MRTEGHRRLKFIISQIVIIIPIFLALIAYVKHGIQMNQVKKEYRKLVEMEKKLYVQYEDLLFEKEELSAPRRVEKIAIKKYGFVIPENIFFEKEVNIGFYPKVIDR